MRLELRLFVYLAVVLITPLSGRAQMQEDYNMLTIESDMQTADDITGVVTATGNVRISYPAHGVVATSRQAQYFNREARVVLSGDVDVVEESGSLLRAERLTYQIDEEQVVAESTEDQQVFSQLIIRSKIPALMPFIP